MIFGRSDSEIRNIKHNPPAIHRGWGATSDSGFPSCLNLLLSTDLRLLRSLLVKCSSPLQLPKNFFYAKSSFNDISLPGLWRFFSHT